MDNNKTNNLNNYFWNHLIWINQNIFVSCLQQVDLS